MSLTTWKKEFYPKPPTKRMTWKSAILHSIKKWEGALPENLQKHKLEIDDCRDLRNAGYREGCKYDSFVFDQDTCALCVKTMDKNGDQICGKCPLFYAQHQKPCGKGTPYGDSMEALNDKLDPAPMLSALRNLLQIGEILR